MTVTVSRPSPSASAVHRSPGHVENGTVDAALFRQVFRRHAAGVAVVTTDAGRGAAGSPSPRSPRCRPAAAGVVRIGHRVGLADLRDAGTAWCTCWAPTSSESRGRSRPAASTGSPRRRAGGGRRPASRVLDERGRLAARRGRARARPPADRTWSCWPDR